MSRGMYMFWLHIGQVIVSDHVIMLCLIQHVTHHVIGQVSGHVLGHMAQKRELHSFSNPFLEPHVLGNGTYREL